MVKKNEYMFIRFDTIHERDAQTDRQTDRQRMTAKATLDASIARQKLLKLTTDRHEASRGLSAIA